MPRGSKYFMGMVVPSSFSKDLQTSRFRFWGLGFRVVPEKPGRNDRLSWF